MKINSLDDLILLATEREGKCLSTEFTDKMSDYSWRCKKGHTFDLSPFLVSKGAWCAQCSKRKTHEEHFQWFQNYALEKGGKCLSTEFINRSTKLSFECAHGHQWLVLPATIIYEKTWCKKCAGLAQLGLDDMKQWAIERGGECLSSSYKGRESKLLWTCSLGHEFKYSPRMIQRGAWCMECKTGYNQVDSMDLMKTWAEEREGKLISTSYLNNESPLDWECKNGHHFKKTRDQVKQLNASNWCSRCNSKTREVIRETSRLKEMRLFAEEKGGKCLSENYQNLYSLLKFVCSKGHQWETRAHTVIYARSWCPECNMDRLRKGKSKEEKLEEIHQYAQEKGGKCLSTTYKNSYSKMKLECAKGHQWETNAENIIYGRTWCPECHLERIRTGRKPKK
jgi:hypothetical protein